MGFQLCLSSQPKQATHTIKKKINMDAANMSGTFAVSTARSQNYSRSNSTGSSGNNGTSTPFGSFGGYSTSPSQSTMNVFKRRDANDTMSGGLSTVHKYLGSPF